MVSELGVTVTGLYEFRRELRRLGKQWPKELGKAHNRVGKIVADEAVRRAPSGPHQGGGTVTPIKRSIKALRRQSGVAIAMGGARSPHAPPTEFGGSLRRYASQSRTTVRQRAFLYPAIAAKTDAVVLVYSEAINSLVSEAFNE